MFNETTTTNSYYVMNPYYVKERKKLRRNEIDTFMTNIFMTNVFMLNSHHSS